MFPVEVAKGWLPNVKESIKTREDDKLLEAKVLELIPQTNQYQTPFIRILSKRERMTIPEKEIISMACIPVSYTHLDVYKRQFHDFYKYSVR